MAQLVGVDVGQPGGGAGLVDVAGDGVPVGRLAVLPGQQQRVGGVDVRGAVLVDQGDQVRVQRQVAVLAELADRDVQPRAGADLHDRVGLQAGVLADPQAGAQQHLHRDAHEQALVVLRGAQQFRGAGIVERLGSGWSERGRSPVNIGTFGGASSQPHSSRRMKNIRSVPSRWMMVPGVSRGLFCPGRAASQGL